MRKIVCIFLLMFGIFNVFGNEYKLICETNSHISESDVIDCFLEEINKISYRYQIWKYQINKLENEQNHEWKIYTLNKEDINYVFLFMNNGCLFFASSNYNFRSGNDNAIDTNSVRLNKLDNDYGSVITEYIKESKIWLLKFDRDYNKNEYFALRKLLKIHCLLNYTYFEDTSDLMNDYQSYRTPLLKEINDTLEIKSDK